MSNEPASSEWLRQGKRPLWDMIENATEFWASRHEGGFGDWIYLWNNEPRATHPGRPDCTYWHVDGGCIIMPPEVCRDLLRIMLEPGTKQRVVIGGGMLGKAIKG